ncbi:hypothetical protein LSTR_LSTR006124 [Laodelphax striatellus]|uniref:Uncharacterized protein n=1 Tax=Laodelphax striatellus TaxID=195883 RepID=A0A482WY82_LAOST|nr:hypothetical protein LSTR_LSTR006124 [Laodelphax striatellus]
MRAVAAASNNGAIKKNGSNAAKSVSAKPQQQPSVAQGSGGGGIAAFFVNKFRRNRQRFTDSDGNNNSSGGGVRRGIVRRRESPRRSQEVKVVVVSEGDSSSVSVSSAESSESLESVDPEIVEKFIEEVEYYRRCNVVDGVIYADKTGPTVETQTPEKKKVGGIRRLLTPTLFSGDGRRSKVGQLDKRNGDSSPGKAPVIETAFVGDERRSKSVSPCRLEPRYGVAKTRPTQNNLQGLTVDTGRPPSAASTISSTSTSTLVTPQASPNYRDRLLILSRENTAKTDGSNANSPNSPSRVRPRFYNIESPVRFSSPDNNLIKPQPLYNSTTPRRPRSVSPDTAASSPEYFIRGAGHRNTIGTVRSRQSTIYEEVDDAGLQIADKAIKRFDSPAGSGKRVSFSPNRQQEVYWPTRKGPSVEPPTRRGGGETAAAAPDRPLPPVPRPRGSGEYGRLPPPANQPVTRRVQALANRWQHQSESESGSEAGEIQRILHNTYYKFQDAGFIIWRERIDGSDLGSINVALDLFFFSLGAAVAVIRITATEIADQAIDRTRLPEQWTNGWMVSPLSFPLPPTPLPVVSGLELVRRVIMEHHSHQWSSLVNPHDK